MEGEILNYRSDSDDDIVEDGLSVNPPRKRGKGLSWLIVSMHDNLQAGFKSMIMHNVPVVTRLKGRNNRGKTASYYFHCVKKSCGCNKQWRLVTLLDSLLVSEEESTEDHICHDNFRRNGGRGMSTEQVAIVDEAFRIGLKKPKLVLKYFQDKALQNPTVGELYTSTYEVTDHLTKFVLFFCQILCQMSLFIRSPTKYRITWLLISAENFYPSVKLLCILCKVRQG